MLRLAAHSCLIFRGRPQNLRRRRDLSAARAVVRNAQTAVQAQAEWDNLLGPLVQEAGLNAETLITQDTASLLDEAQSSVSSLRQLRVQGEQLSLGLARTAELAQREELEHQLAALDRAIVERQTSIDARLFTGVDGCLSFDNG